MGGSAKRKVASAANAETVWDYKVRLDGVLPVQELRAAFEAGMLTAEIPPVAGPKGQFQPASFDTRLGEYAVCIKNTFLPQKGESIEKVIQKEKDYDFDLSHDKTHVLKHGQTYAVLLEETANLRPGFYGAFNPKSTSGRSDCLTRVLVEDVPNFDTILPGKERKMWVEITPLSGDIGVRRGTTLSQLRIRNGRSRVTEDELRDLYKKTPLLFDPDGRPIPYNKVRFKDGGIEMTTDIEADIPAYRTRDDADMAFDLSLPKGALFDKRFEFYEPIHRKGKSLNLRPDPRFYLLATWERVRVPPNLCGTLMAYDVTSAEGRVHYAGFFDPGFDASGTLEVRVYHRPFRVAHRQPICVIHFEHMRSPPIDETGKLMLYGKTLGSSYQNQPRGPNLPKQCQLPDNK